MNDKNEFQGIGDRPEDLASLIRLVADRANNPVRHKTKICLLLGAGADISSGGLSFADLKRQALEEFSQRMVFDITGSDDIETRFESLFLRLEPDERALLVESVFRKLQPLAPSDAYKLLVLLVEAGGVDAVVTTNFDIMLERAQQQLGRDLFQIFAPGLARPYLLSESRFELPKKPYLKLHGDIATRSVLLLTATDLEHVNYDASMLELLTSILRSHDLILAGYSGYDVSLARIIAETVEKTANRIFWCSPNPPSSTSPLYARISSRVRFVRIKFDELMAETARPVLEKPSLVGIEPTFLRCLFDWRIDYCNREYVQLFGRRSGKSVVDTFARRRTIEDHIASFLQSDRGLSIITGPSGFGKTTIGIRLYRTKSTLTSAQVLLIRSRALPTSGDIEQYLSEQLGGLGSQYPFSLFKFERWLKESGIRLTLFIDGINEFSPDLVRCIELLRNVIRFCYFLPESNSALRVIATIRQETWNAMLPLLDIAQLRKTLWSETESEDSFNTIACDAFTDEELTDAITRLREQGYASIEVDRLPSSTADQLHDPYLLGIMADTVHAGLSATSTANIYQRAFELKLRRSGVPIDVALLKDILASVALKCLDSQQDRFRESDIHPWRLRDDVVRVMKDLHVFIETGDGFLQFDHDRTFEYFLALGLGSGAGPRLETIEDLRQYLGHFKGQTKAIAAARLYFQLAPKERFSIISTALRLQDSGPSRYDRADREMLFGFAREIVVEMADHGEPLIEQYLEDAIHAARTDDVGEQQLRTIVQAAASLPIDRAIPLLSQVVHASSPLARTEAAIYATDKLVKQYLMSCSPSTNLISDAPYATFFADTSILPWQRLGRLLGFMSQLGPDNSHPEEYESIRQVLSRAFDQVLRDTPWDSAAADAFSSFFLENCDRLLFNATPNGIRRFFGNPKRKELAAIVHELENGKVLTEKDLLVFEPYTQSLSSDIEYHLSHILFILSSFNDVEATMRLAEARLAVFSNSTPPEEIDFFQAVIVYLHVLHGLKYDESRFGRWEDLILREWPDVLLYRPGVERGERRGFQDFFDRVFEDGFGVIYPYGVLLPSIQRQRFHYLEYRRLLAGEKQSQLPLYSRHLEGFLRADRIDEALQVLQALAGVIVVWPTEGLLTLRNVIGHSEPRIRRAVVRILAEAFNRHPEETMQFLRTSGAAVSDEDLIEIKIRQEARIGRRQIEEEEWGRIGHFLLSRPGARLVFFACIHSLLSADSFPDAVTGILQSLGLVDIAGR